MVITDQKLLDCPTVFKFARSVRIVSPSLPKRARVIDHDSCFYKDSSSSRPGMEEIDDYF
ncbi:hypothetical protein Scep_009744 [Stephania cephalantha]|uniref:Uncharacterized protein n=1 Tax=Stephania cephalantha TaxID=152367 RepID=A0AAP0PCS2_9MAGN